MAKKKYFDVRVVDGVTTRETENRRYKKADLTKMFERGILAHGKSLRRITEQQEINAWRYSEELFKLLTIYRQKIEETGRVDPMSKSAQQLTQQVLERDLQSEEFEPGRTEQFTSKGKWSALDNANKAIGRVLGTKGTNLGHTELAVLTTNIALLMKFERAKKPVDHEKIAVLQKTLAVSNAIDNLKVCTKDMTLADVMEGMGDEPIELRWLYQLGSGTLDGTATLTVDIEDAVSNRCKGQLGGSLQSALAEMYGSFTDEKGFISGKRSNSIVDTMMEVVPNVSASPTLLDKIDNVLDNAIAGKKLKKVTGTKKRGVVKPKFKKKVRKRTSQQNSKIKRLGVSFESLAPLRSKKGRFTSNVGLQNLLNSQITETIKENMGSPALNNQTGRFAESVVIQKLSQSRQGRITAFYTYMKYPYQTFERGYRQGSTRRDPRRLISQSIREIALEAMGSTLDIRTRRV